MELGNDLPLLISMKQKLALIDANPLGELSLPVAGLETDAAGVHDLLEHATRLRAALRLDGWEADVRDRVVQRVASVLRQPDAGDRLRQAGARLLAARQGRDVARARFATAAGRDVSIGQAAGSLPELSARLTALADARHLLRDWSA